MLSSSRRMRSLSASDSSSRASRATCSTSFSEIFGSATLDLLQVRVLKREPLAPDAGEMHGRDHVRTLALDADPQALAPARGAGLRAQPAREVLRPARRGGGG